MSSPVQLLILDEDDFPVHPLSRRPPPGPIVRPAPLQHFEIEQETPDGVRVDRIVRWRNEDARDCRFCESCNFMPGADGQGMCVIRKPAMSGARTAT